MDEHSNTIRVGCDFQATVPNKSTLRPLPAPDATAEHAVLVWSPYNTNLSEDQLDEYCNIAKEKYSYNTEQALGMLCWHKFDLNTALADLPNFTPFPDEWTVEDKVLFEQAFQFHDKHFHKIKQMLPDKSIASLVKYYYSWKKTRTRMSLMDRQARRLKEDQKDEEDSEGDEDSAGSDQEAVDENKDVNGDDMRDHTAKQRCDNCCTTVSGQFNQTSKGLLCKACYSFWRRTGSLKSNGAGKRLEGNRQPTNGLKPKRKPPKGIYCDLEDLVEISKEPGKGEAMLKALDFDIVNLKRQVQNHKQMISQNKHKISAGIKSCLVAETSVRMNSRWTKEEELLAVQAFRKYGKDFIAIAEIMGNKTEAHIKAFYHHNERRYNVNKYIKEYESEKNSLQEKEPKRQRVDGAA
ncbi:REST corepressor 3 [Halotydeus destructor]|nr:REST corepressor 3 [Halotydeus destructor]